MSNVSGPTDGGYNYYHKQVADLEEEFEAQAKSSRKAQDEYESRLAEKQKQIIQETRDDADVTVQNTRKSALEANRVDREVAKEEIKQIKQESYDRFGRSNGLEADVLKDQIETMTAGHEQERKNWAAKYEDATNGHQQRVSDQQKRYQEDMENAVRVTHENLQESYDRKLAQVNEEAKELKKETREKIDETNREKHKEINEANRRADRTITEIERTNKHQTEKLRNYSTVKSDQRERAAAHETEDAVRTTNEVHSKENSQLRDQLKEIARFQDQWKAEKGSASAEAVKEFEDVNRTERQLIEESYQRQISKLKQQMKEDESYYAHLQNRSLREKDAYFTDKIAKQQVDNHGEKKDLANTFNREYAQLEKRRSRDNEMSSKRMESAMYDAGVTREKALEKQAQAYQTTIANQQLSQGEKIKLMERELQRKATSNDTQDISPAAEAAVTKVVSAGYEKQFSAEKDRNKASQESLRLSYSQRLEDTVLDFQDKETRIQRANTNEAHFNKTESLDYMKEQEYMKDTALRSMRADQDRQNTNLTRNFALSMEKQRREYENIIAALRDDASVKLAALRQETDFSSKMAHRAFAQKQNEIIREYDKKLADQKLHYEGQVDQARTEASKAVRESDRKTRQALDQQAQGYEMRMAQSEVQWKERERHMQNNFEESMERLKRSNALLISKKS